MSITPRTDKWLINAGYEYHCFISWAHTQNNDMTECARVIKQEIEQKLALSFNTPRVFLDETEIQGGADWKKKLLRSLCRSVSMVSLCAPIYYHPSHKWCGFEWAAMAGLSKKRLPREDFKTIIPILIKQGELPNAVSSIQYIDFSPVVIRGRSYYRSNDFKNKIYQIAERIETIAKAMEKNNAVPNCDDFKQPPKSAFLDYEIKSLGLPFRGTKQNGN